MKSQCKHTLQESVANILTSANVHYARQQRMSSWSQKPSNLNKLLNCVKQRSEYKDQYYVEVESKIITIKDDERDNCQYHRSCYSDSTHKGSYEPR